MPRSFIVQVLAGVMRSTAVIYKKSSIVAACHRPLPLLEDTDPHAEH